MIVAIGCVLCLIVPAIILRAKGMVILWMGLFAGFGMVELLVIYGFAWWTILINLFGWPLTVALTVVLLEVAGYKVLSKKNESITNEIRELVKKPENTWKSWLFTLGLFSFPVILWGHFYLGW